MPPDESEAPAPRGEPALTTALTTTTATEVDKNDDTAQLDGRAQCRAVLADIARRQREARRRSFEGLDGAAFLAGHRRRREAAVRLEGGDPEHPGHARHHLSAGVTLTGLREGHTYGVRYACRELWRFLNADGQAAAQHLVAAAHDREATAR